MKFVKTLFAITILVVSFISPIAPMVAAASSTWNYTALGDSLAFGVFDFQQGGYVPRFGSYIQADTGNTINLTNLGQNGWRSDQLLNALRTNTTFRNAVTNSQVVTWDIGGNDFLHILSSYQGGTCGGADNQNCLRSAVTAFKANWSAIITEILTLRGKTTTIIRTMNIYNPYVNAEKAMDSWANDGGLNDFQVLKLYLDEANNYIATTATANNIPYAKVYEAFNGPNGDQDAGDKGYLAFDGLHPNELGHRVIADLFRNLSYAPLTSNPIDDPQAFVTQHYLDFLSRQPDQSGLDYWTGQLTQCGADTTCTLRRRVEVSAAYFTSLEFQQSGYFIYLFYIASLGRQPSFAEFILDRNQVVGGINLDAGKAAFAQAWVSRTDFSQQFPSAMTADQFVDKLLAIVKQASGADLTAQRGALIGLYDGTNRSRAAIVRQVVESQALVNAEYNQAFVLMQYFGYLRRDPDADGYNFWLRVMGGLDPGAFKGMTCAFITSREYQERFSSLVTHSNADCGRVH